MPIKSIKGLVFYKQPFCAFWFYVQNDFNKANASLERSLRKRPKPLSFYLLLLKIAT